MAMNSLQYKGVMVNKNKDDIIKKYKSGTEIVILASENNVSTDMLLRRLKTWGIKIRKGDFRKKPKQKGHWYRRFSKGLLIRQAENTRINNDRIKYVNGINKMRDQRLVRNILNHPAMG